MRDDVYSPLSVRDPKSNLSTSPDRGVDRGARERKKRSRDKKGDNYDGCSIRKRKKKRNQFSE